MLNEGEKCRKSTYSIKKRNNRESKKLYSKTSKKSVRSLAM